MSIGILVHNSAPFSIPFCHGLSIDYFSIKMIYDGITEENRRFAHDFHIGLSLMVQNFILIEIAMYIILYLKVNTYFFADIHHPLFVLFASLFNRIFWIMKQKQSTRLKSETDSIKRGW